MPDSKVKSTARPIQQLWHTLVVELADVFDAHFVYATIATEIASYSGQRTVVGVSDPQREYYDVWICEPDGTQKQERWQSGKASFSPILNSESPVHLVKFNRPVSELIDSELWLLAEEDIYAVRLPSHRESAQVAPPGVLCLIDPPAEDKLGLTDLEDLSRGLTVYLDRASLRRQVDQQEIEFAVVSDISHLLTSTLSMERVFQELTGTIRRILQVESLSVGLREPNTGDIVFVESLMGSRPGNLHEIRVKPGQGIAGWVAEHGEAVIVNDTYGDHRFYAKPDRLSGFRTRSMICIPLQVEARTIGVLQAINKRFGQFTSHDLSLLQAIGGPLAAAIENSRLHNDVVSEKRRIETILAGMSDALLAVTVDGYITRVNDAFHALLRAEGAEPIGQQVESVFPELSTYLPGLINAAKQQDNDSAQVAVNLPRPDGEAIPVLISAAAMRDETDGVHEVILTLSDLTQVREVERMRDDLFHAIAHELRTPLATILMYARLLREGKAQDQEKVARFLEVIERESDRLQYMVRRMMQLAKQQARELQRSPESLLLNPIFDDVLPPLADQATHKGLFFRRNIEPDLPPVLGDVERIEEIVNNIVGNAIKFSLSGTIRFDARTVDDQVIIEVSDQGIGIPKQALPNLFKRFYRAQSAVDRGIAGTGLGLYMVKQSVDQYNGSITVASREGEGSTVTVTFPIHDE